MTDVYGDWIIGGLTPSRIEKVTPDMAKRQITLNCASDLDINNDDNPMTEIEDFMDMQCDVISNEQLLNGGSKLQVCNGEIVTVTDGYNTWQGAVEAVNLVRDSYAKHTIWYDLVMQIETVAPLRSFVYTPHYAKYGNVEYCSDTDKVCCDYNDTCHMSLGGGEIGWMRITETLPVKRVEIFGSGCCLPAWIECNGQRFNWSKTHEGYWLVGDTQPRGVEPHTFNINPPTNIITFQTAPHTTPISCSANHGCWLMYTKNVYALG